MGGREARGSKMRRTKKKEVLGRGEGVWVSRSMSREDLGGSGRREGREKRERRG